MNGTKLQFGHYESSDGDASFADRGLGIDPSNPFPEKPLRLAEGMDIAAHRAWSGADYSTISSEQQLIFWDSYSNLFDLNRDLVSLDPHLAQLNEMMDGDTNANYLTVNGLIEIAPSSSDLDLSYSFYRIDRNLIASADTNAVVENNELTQAERAELAKYWYVNPNETSDTLSSLLT